MKFAKNIETISFGVNEIMDIVMKANSELL
jgi:hypothetical protein